MYILFVRTYIIYFIKHLSSSWFRVDDVHNFICIHLYTYILSIHSESFIMRTFLAVIRVENLNFILICRSTSVLFCFRHFKIVVHLPVPTPIELEEYWRIWWITIEECVWCEGLLKFHGSCCGKNLPNQYYN